MSLTSLAAPLNRGVVRESFEVVQGRQLLSYRIGQVIHVDAFTRITIEAADGDVHWGDQDVVPGLPFARPPVQVAMASLRPGLIYAAESVDDGEARAAHKAGRLARVTVVVEGQKPVHGWILAN